MPASGLKPTVLLAEPAPKLSPPIILCRYTKAPLCRPLAKGLSGAETTPQAPGVQRQLSRKGRHFEIVLKFQQSPWLKPCCLLPKVSPPGLLPRSVLVLL